VGVAKTDKIFYSAATGIGNPIVYVGSKTGRDGIHGATMASADFAEDSEEKRPTVQVGDPFTEILLIEACLELMATDAIVAIQDMGAAGLTSSSVEMASKGGAGIRLDMDKVPCREEGMTPYEMMLSESQERMLMVLKPGREAEAEAIFRKWELDFAVIGEVTDTGHMVLEFNGEVVCDIPLGPLADEAPCYERPYAIPKAPEPLTDIPESTDIAADLLKLMGSPALASRRWVWEQYDQSVGADTVQRPGGDAAVVRVHGSKKALAITTDCTPRYCYADPYEGGKQAVAEAYRNLCAVGAKPLAITNCLNFGNPQRPEIMGQFVGCIEGIAEACSALDFPVVSGNVSLYNETKNEDGSSLAILPTPAIGGVGLLEDWERSASIAPKADGNIIFLIGTALGHLGQTVWMREIQGRTKGMPPAVDLRSERENGTLIRRLIESGTATAVHDISDGGLLVALAEMALASGMGMTISALDLDVSPTAFAFGEDQGRYLVATEEPDRLRAIAAEANIEIQLVAVADRPPRLRWHTAWQDAEWTEVPLAELRAAHEGFFPKLMGSELVPEF
ncbi:MAG TPA: phosphoribosylformylglycinamidine synthase subunit PurL, partial [Sphingomicrobium sp.]|nr:phosphoribosylformylglycinamidine synthase subunit PurL [Sphingomicrobium sp.]